MFIDFATIETRRADVGFAFTRPQAAAVAHGFFAATWTRRMAVLTYRILRFFPHGQPLLIIRVARSYFAFLCDFFHHAPSMQSQCAVL